MVVLCSGYMLSGTALMSSAILALTGDECCYHSMDMMTAMVVSFCDQMKGLWEERRKQESSFQAQQELVKARFLDSLATRKTKDNLPLQKYTLALLISQKGKQQSVVACAILKSRLSRIGSLGHVHRQSEPLRYWELPNLWSQRVASAGCRNSLVQIHPLHDMVLKTKAKSNPIEAQDLVLQVGLAPNPRNIQLADDESTDIAERSPSLILHFVPDSIPQDLNNEIEDRCSLVHGQTEMGLVLSADVKPRLKWTPNLHRRFIDAVSKLGGTDKATPKAVMRVMGIPGLTLYHLKSHLQKFRLASNEKTQTCSDSKKQGFYMAENRASQFGSEDRERPRGSNNEGLQIAEALRMQMEMQKKLHEQIEVQRHLQLRIEAQGKYLQSVLKTAQEALAPYSSSGLMLQPAKSDLTEAVSTVETQCLSSPISELTVKSDPGFQKQEKRWVAMACDAFTYQPQPTECSLDSCLTSSECSGRKTSDPNSGFKTNGQNGICIIPSVERSKTSLSDEAITLSDDICVDQPQRKRPLPEKSTSQSKKCRSSEVFDLNCEYQSEADSGWQELDLNCNCF
ncbi:hypothetical protein ACLOJK_029158 [Asimina triloba]